MRPGLEVGPCARAMVAGLGLYALVLAACAGGGDGGQGPGKYVTVAPDSVLMIVGQQRGLTATFHEANGSLIAGTSFKWRSDDSTVASVDSLAGDVTAKGLGSTYVHATETGGTDGKAKIMVGLPTGACNGIENVESWAADIDLAYHDGASQSPNAVTIATNHHAASFTLILPPGPPNPLATTILWSAVPTTSSYEVDETITDQSTVPTTIVTVRAGNVDLLPPMPLLLSVDKNACTWQIHYGPFYTAVITTSGSSKPDSAGMSFATLQSALVPLEIDWQLSGIGGNLNSSFPVYPGDQQGAHENENFYGVGDGAAQVLFTLVTPPRGPANVTFHASPHLPTPVRAGRR